MGKQENRVSSPPLPTIDGILTALMATNGLMQSGGDLDGLLRTIEQTLQFEGDHILHAHYVDPDQPKIIYCLHITPDGTIALQAEGMRITNLTEKIHPEARAKTATLQALNEEREAIEHLADLCELAPPISNIEAHLQQATGLVPEGTETAATFVSFVTLATELKTKLQTRMDGTKDQPGWKQRRRQVAKAIATLMQEHHPELYDAMYMARTRRKRLPFVPINALNWFITDGIVHVELHEPVKEPMEAIPDAMRQDIVRRLTPKIAERLTACQCQVLGLTTADIQAVCSTQTTTKANTTGEAPSDHEIDAQAAAEMTIMGDGPTALEQFVAADVQEQPLTDAETAILDRVFQQSATDPNANEGPNPPAALDPCSLRPDEEMETIAPKTPPEP